MHTLPSNMQLLFCMPQLEVAVYRNQKSNHIVALILRINWLMGTKLVERSALMDTKLVERSALMDTKLVECSAFWGKCEGVG